MKNPRLKKRFVWQLYVMMAKRNVRSRAQLQRMLAGIGIKISSVHAGRIVNDMPELMNMELLAGLMTVLDCNLEDLLIVENVTPDDNGGGDDKPEKSDTEEKDDWQPAAPEEKPRRPVGRPTVPKTEVKKKPTLELVKDDFNPLTGPDYGSIRNIGREELKK